MRSYKSNLGKVLLVIIFALTFVSTPVYAEETIEEPGDISGSEWSGEIKDPEPTPVPQPVAPTPEPAQPAPTPTPAKTPTATPKTVATPVAETPTVETPTEETPVEEAPQEETPAEQPEETQPEETPQEEIPQIPETAKESEESIKSKIIAILIGIVFIFMGIITWALRKVYQVAKYEKIYKDALKKSHEVRKANITRAG